MKVINNLNVPQSWDEVSFKKYNQLINLEVDYRDENSVAALNSTIEIVSILCEVDKSVIENLNAKDYIAINNCVKFVSDPIVNKKSTWNFIDIEDLKMDKWLAYESYRKDVSNHLLDILLILQSDYNKETLNNMAVTEVLYGFFMLQKKCQKYITSFQRYFLRKMFKWKMKIQWKKLKSKVLWQKK